MWSRVILWTGILAVAGLAFLALALVTGWPVITPLTQSLAFLAVFVLVAGLFTILLLIAREWLLAGIAAVLMGYFGVTVFEAASAPSWPADAADETIRVVTANLQLGQASPALVSHLMDKPADLVFVQECDDRCVAALQAPDVRRALPHRLMDPDPSPGGAAILSVWPIEDMTVPETTMSQPAAKVFSPLGDLTIRSAHPTPPVPGSMDDWSEDLAELARFAAEAEGPVIIAGDFNATPYHRQYRDIADSGSLIEAVGAYPGTWRSGWPGFLRTPIDHILIPDNWRAVSTTVEELEGSDHSLVRASVLPL